MSVYGRVRPDCSVSEVLSSLTSSGLDLDSGTLLEDLTTRIRLYCCGRKHLVLFSSIINDSDIVMATNI